LLNTLVSVPEGESSAGGGLATTGVAAASGGSPDTVGGDSSVAAFWGVVSAGNAEPAVVASSAGGNSLGEPLPGVENLELSCSEFIGVAPTRQEPSVPGSPPCPHHAGSSDHDETALNCLKATTRKLLAKADIDLPSVLWGTVNDGITAQTVRKGGSRGIR
jgi:hypothetical protein